MLKEWLKKWLEVPKPERFTEDAMRHMMLDVLDDALDRHGEHRTYMKARVANIVENLCKSAVSNLTSEEIKSIAIKEWEEVIKTINKEEFIDNVIDRIKRKQISA